MHIQSVRCQMCVYMYTYSSQYRDAGRAKEIKKTWDSSECHAPSKFNPRAADWSALVYSNQYVAARNIEQI